MAVYDYIGGSWVSYETDTVGSYRFFRRPMRKNTGLKYSLEMIAVEKATGRTLWFKSNGICVFTGSNPTLKHAYTEEIVNDLPWGNDGVIVMPGTLSVTDEFTYMSTPGSLNPETDFYWTYRVDVNEFPYSETIVAPDVRPEYQVTVNVPPPANPQILFGEHQAMGAGGYPVTGATITSDTGPGEFDIVAGYLVPAQAGLTVGTGTLTTDTGETFDYTVEAGKLYVRTDQELSDIDAIPAWQAGGTTTVIREDNTITGAVRLRPNAGEPLTESFVTAENQNTKITKIWMHGVTNLTLRDMTIERLSSGDMCPLTGPTSNIKFERVTFRGDAGLLQGRADAFRHVGSGGIGTAGLSFVDCVFEDLNQALTIYASDGVTVTGNRFTRVYNDSIFMYAGDGNRNVLISGNTFEAGEALETDTGNPHPDYVQITAGSTMLMDSDNWTIENNLFGQKGGRGKTQAIFMGVEPTAFKITNLVIRGNMIIGSMSQGIWAGNAENPLIHNNTIINDLDKAAGTISTIRLTETTGAQIYDNAAPVIDTADPTNTGTVETNNHIWTDVTGTLVEYQAALMGSDFGNGVTDIAAELAPRVGGPLDQPTKIGAGWP